MMNAEIYSLHKNSKGYDLSESDKSEMIDALLQKDINIKNSKKLSYNHRKLVRTLKETKETEIVFILNGLGKTNSSPVMMAFEKICKKLNKETGNLTTNKKDYILDLYSLGDFGNGYNACFTVYNDTMFVALPKSDFTGKSELSMMLDAVDRLNNNGLVSPSNKDSLASNGYPYFEYEKTYVSPLSWKYYIPVKGDGTAEVIRKLGFITALIVAMVSGGMLINSKLIAPTQAQNTYNELKDIYYGAKETDTDKKADTDVKDSDSTDTSSEEVDPFEALAKINDEVQGWITIPKTKNIDYPVMQSKYDNATYQKYLWTDFNGKKSNYGSIFIDYRSKKGVDSKNVILHGHNNGDDLMFSEICKYKSASFYTSAPTFTFNTRDGATEYVVFAVFITNTRSEHGIFFDYLRGTFSGESEFMNYVYQCRMRSVINTPVTVNEDDELMTLSTCSYEYKDFRTVVVARKVRDYEKKNGFSFNTDYTYYNSDPIYPTVWYRDKGGRPSPIGLFEDALKNSYISWYDGNGISGKKIDLGIFFINENPDYNEVASSKPESDTEDDTSIDTSSDNIANIESNVDTENTDTITTDIIDTSDDTTISVSSDTPIDNEISENDNENNNSSEP